MTRDKTSKDPAGKDPAVSKPIPPKQRKRLGGRLRPSVVMGLLAAALGSTSAKGAETPELAAILGETIPAHEALVSGAEALGGTLSALCAAGAGAAETTAARAALADLLADWARLQPYTFGPVEDQNHRARFQFWPDVRNITGRQVEGLLRGGDRSLLTADVFPTTSIAVQGLPAVTALLYPRDGGVPELARGGDRGAYACALAEAIDTNLVAMAKTMLDAWTNPETGWTGRVAATAEGEGPMGTVDALDALLLASVDQGLAVIKDLKLEKALGKDFQHPRPTAAEASETGQAMRYVLSTMEATEALYTLSLGPKVAAVDATLDAQVRADMTDILERMRAIEPPLSEAVADLRHRFRVEDVVGRLDSLRARLALRVAPALNIVMGFNSLDGD
jgi:predicted lipoprotein